MDLSDLPCEILMKILGFDNSCTNLLFTDKYFFSLISLISYNIDAIALIFVHGQLDVIKYVNYLKSINDKTISCIKKFKKITKNQALIISCQYNHIEVVKYLIGMGADFEQIIIMLSDGLVKMALLK